jgi:hypothetical protein
MFLTHFVQLLLLRDINLLFVTDDRAFFRYYAGERHVIHAPIHRTRRVPRSQNKT